MENQADKSQEATPYKLEEARKKGQIGKSAEFVSISSLIVMLVTFLILLPRMATSFAQGLERWLVNTNQLVTSNVLILKHVEFFLRDVGFTVSVMLAAGALSTILFNLLHAGPVFSLHPLKFDLTKLNPVTGLKKIFSKKGLFEIFKLVLKIVFIFIAIAFLWGQIKNFVLYQNSTSIYNILENWKYALVSVIVCFLLIFLCFSLFDLWFNKRDFARKMKMSHRDIKDEYKKREGDPEIKHKRKNNMQKLMKNVLSTSSVKNADVIITNPTHYAVALQYRAHKMPLPKVLTKGRGFLAKLIIFRAKKLGIPILRKPALARKIFRDAAISSYIPTSEQVIVAEVYREIMNRPGSKVFT